MKVKRLQMFLISACLLFSLLPLNTYAATFTDIDGHWAQQTIQELSDDGIIAGRGDGLFEPDVPISRAEFFTLANKVFDFTKEAAINFQDVKESDWFAVQIKRAVAAGYLAGYEDNTARPNNNITRGEAAVVISKLLHLPEAAGASNKFNDVSHIPQWSKPFVDSVVGAGFINGDTNGNIRANDSLTRAEAAVIIASVKSHRQQATDTLMVTAGYGPEKDIETINHNVKITGDGAVLRNVIIKGDLEIHVNKGSQAVSLMNVTVEGNLIFKGEGSYTVKASNSNFTKADVNLSSGNLTFILAENSHLQSIDLHTPAKLAEDAVTGEGFETVNIAKSLEASTVELNGTFTEVFMNGPKGTLKLTAGRIDSLHVTREALNSKIYLEKNTFVTNAFIDAVCDLSGQGKIKTAMLTVEDVTSVDGLIESYAKDSKKAKIVSASTGSGSSGGSSVDDSGGAVNNQYTVTFVSNGGTPVASQSVKSGSKALSPANPTKSGFTFAGWYTDSSLGNPFDFNTAVYANITLYAKWQRGEIQENLPEYAAKVDVARNVLNVGVGHIDVYVDARVAELVFSVKIYGQDISLKNGFYRYVSNSEITDTLDIVYENIQISLVSPLISQEGGRVSGITYNKTFGTNAYIFLAQTVDPLKMTVKADGVTATYLPDKNCFAATLSKTSGSADVVLAYNGVEVAKYSLPIVTQ